VTYGMKKGRVVTVGLLVFMNELMFTIYSSAYVGMEEKNQNN